MAEYPLISSALKGHYATRFEEAVKTLENGKEAGGIPQIRFNEAKQAVNRAMELAWDELVRAPFINGGKWRELPEELRNIEMNLNRPAAHLVAGQLKRIEKMLSAAPSVRNHRMAEAMVAILKEAQPLGELVSTLKGMIVKREPKPVEDRKEKYLAPMASGTAMAQVQQILTDITTQTRAKLTENIVEQYNRYLQRFLDAQKEAAEAGKNLKPYDFYRSSSSRYMNMDAYEVVSAATKNTGVGGRTDPVEVRPNAQEIFKERAAKVADEICQEFVVKNLVKLDSIIEKKGDFQSAKVISTTVRYGLEGKLRFTFADGAEFTVMLQAVGSHSKHGTFFLRFPVTFHDVKMSDGSKMKTPNEQKMNTIFVDG